jgi:probable F420-dependent oxidoreductase
MRNVKVGVQIVPQYGDMAVMRKRWMEAEALGADFIYNADHFHAQIVDQKLALEAAHSKTIKSANSFESTTHLAAIAATTTRVELGCMVHANSYRNPNLLADIARTIDHISGGRFILGIGSGYLQVDYDEYGYPYGTTASRLADLARDMPIIKARFEKLNPKPLRKIPILIASMGDKLGLRIVAEHADIWSFYGSVEKIEQKTEKLEEHCKAVGRDASEIIRDTAWMPSFIPDSDPDTYLKMGITRIWTVCQGPDWDFGEFKELLAWRKALR